MDSFKQILMGWDIESSKFVFEKIFLRRKKSSISDLPLKISLRKLRLKSRLLAKVEVVDFLSRVRLQ